MVSILIIGYLLKKVTPFLKKIEKKFIYYIIV